MDASCHDRDGMRAAREDLAAALVLLRTLPDRPARACEMLGRAAAELGLEPGVDLDRIRRAAQGSGRGSREISRAAWRVARLVELRLRAVEGPAEGGSSAWRRWRPVVVAVLAAVIVVAAGFEVWRRGTPGRLQETDIAGVEVADEAASFEVDPGGRLMVNLHSIWHVDLIRVGVRHDRPCRISFIRRGRRMWTAELDRFGIEDDGRYRVELPHRVARRGFERLLIATDPNGAAVRVWGLEIRETDR